jgi:hypothetical protein
MDSKWEHQSLTQELFRQSFNSLCQMEIASQPHGSTFLKEEPQNEKVHLNQY